MATFRYVPGTPPLRGRHVYYEYEYSFSFIPESMPDLEARAGTLGSTSLSIGTLQIEVGIERRNLLHVWGLHQVSWWWKRRKIPPVEPVPGEVIAESVGALQVGVSVGVEDGREWITFIDEATGWILVSYSPELSSDAFIQITGDCVIGLEGRELRAVLIHPEWVTSRE